MWFLVMSVPTNRGRGSAVVAGAGVGTVASNAPVCPVEVGVGALLARLKSANPDSNNRKDEGHQYIAGTASPRAWPVNGSWFGGSV
jgi:hypothetical protein